MLEGIPVVVIEMIVIIGVEEETVFLGKDIAGTDVGPGKLGLGGIAYFEDIPFLILQVSTNLIAQVRGGLAVAHHS